MRKYIFLIPFFLFACKKSEPSTKISIRQQPSKITVFAVDTATGAETVQHEIDYFYNDSVKKFDSIKIDNTVLVFNYSKLTDSNKILLNYTNNLSPYEEIIFDDTHYELTSYSQVPAGISYALQYDDMDRVVRVNYSNTPPADNFFRAYSYGKYDSVYAHTERPNDNCQTNDTILTSYDMSSSLPWLLFADVNSDCGNIEWNILKAASISNSPNKFPSKILRGNMETNFTYTGDTYARLAEALVISTIDNVITTKSKIKVFY